ncbi:15499_t:CDS:1, partial [Dentiscutata heterogama]
LNKEIRALKEEKSQEAINREWNCIEIAIKNEANKALPKPRNAAKRMSKSSQNPITKLRTITKELNKICKKAKKNIDQVILVDTIKAIEIINKSIATELKESPILHSIT